MEAPSERPAANVSAASLCGRRGAQAKGAVGACVRALLSSALSCVLETVAAAAGSLRRANPGAASATAVAAEGKRLLSLAATTSSPGPPGESAASARLDLGTGWHNLLTLSPGRLA